MNETIMIMSPVFQGLWKDNYTEVMLGQYKKFYKKKKNRILSYLSLLSR